VWITRVGTHGDYDRIEWRGLSIDMIRRLHERLGISADVLIRPPRIGKAA